MSALLALDLQSASLEDIARFCAMANRLGIPASTVPGYRDGMLVLPIPAGRVRVTPVRPTTHVSKIRTPAMKHARRARR